MLSPTNDLYQINRAAEVPRQEQYLVLVDSSFKKSEMQRVGEYDMEHVDVEKSYVKCFFVGTKEELTRFTLSLQKDNEKFVILHVDGVLDTKITFEETKFKH
jgi:hypothetical protein